MSEKQKREKVRKIPLLTLRNLTSVSTFGQQGKDVRSQRCDFIGQWNTDRGKDRHGTDGWTDKTAGRSSYDFR